MLKMSSVATISRNHCPTIRENLCFWLSHDNHWLNGNDHTRFQHIIRIVWLNIVKHLRILVHTATYTVPTIETNYREACALYMLLHSSCNTAEAIAPLRCGNPKIQRLLCYLQQMLHLWSNSSYRNSNCRVRMPAVITGGEIDCYNVA